MILQFGTGNFLRAFADLFVDELDQQRSPENRTGPVIAIQSTDGERADWINQSNASYHVVTRGFQDGKLVDVTREVTSVAKALKADRQWIEILQCGLRDDLVAIVSNTTEAGPVLDDRDRDYPTAGSAPHSFPAKLLAILIARCEAGASAVWIVPCELITDNGDHLRAQVFEQAQRWKIERHVTDWIVQECQWVNTLVDRIVPGKPENHPLLRTDPLLVSCEPFALWAVETERPDFPFANHPAVVTAPDISSYTLRKVRILNGAHTALVCRTRGTDITTVRDAVEHPEIGPWLERLLMEEIVPVLQGRCDDPEGFARDTLERFRNPFLNHQLSAIALHHQTKIVVRVQPTVDEYLKKFGTAPPLLTEALFGKTC